MADFLIREGEIVFCKPIARAVLRDVDAFHLVHAVCEGRFFEGLASISENRVFQQNRPEARIDEHARKRPDGLTVRPPIVGS